jgi:hypothetical protein
MNCTKNTQCTVQKSKFANVQQQKQIYQSKKTKENLYKMQYGTIKHAGKTTQDKKRQQIANEDTKN